MGKSIAAGGINDVTERESEIDEAYCDWLGGCLQWGTLKRRRVSLQPAEVLLDLISHEG